MKGSTTKKGDKYYPVVYLGKDLLTGKKKYKWGKGFNLKREAEKQLSEMLIEYHSDKDSGIFNTNLTFSQVSTEWLRSSKQNHAYRTHEMYCSLLKNINEVFSDVNIKDIKPIHLQRYILALEHYSPSTIHKYYTALQNVFKWAINVELIVKNPVQNISLPKIQKKEFTTWTARQVGYFLSIEEIKGSKWNVPFMLGLTKGLRQGEISGLKWSDYDGESLYIQRSMQRDWSLTPPKTNASRRRVLLSSSIIEALNSQKRWQAEMTILFDGEYFESDFICTHEYGGPINPHNIGCAWRKYIEIHKMPTMRFHDSRHTCATMLLEENTNLKVIQELLGHASIDQTANTYAHVKPTIQRDAADVLERKIFGTSNEKVISISS